MVVRNVGVRVVNGFDGNGGKMERISYRPETLPNYATQTRLLKSNSGAILVKPGPSQTHAWSKPVPSQTLAGHF